MQQTIQDFYYQASTRGFSRDFQLRVTNFQIDGQSLLSEDDLVFLKTATLPGKTITSQTAPYMGLSFNIPGAVTFDGSNSWATTFYADQSLDIRGVLEDAMLNSFDHNTSTGDIKPRDLDANKIQLTLFDDELNPLRSYDLLGAYITNIGAINYNATGAGAIQEISTTIAYQYWQPGGVGVASGGRGGRGGGGGGILGGINFAAKLGGLRVSGNVGTVLSKLSGLFKR